VQLNATGEIYDIKETERRVRSAEGAFLLVDGTLAPAPLQLALDCGADMVMHSTTKYYGGHSDLLGGVLVCAREADAKQLRVQRMHLGSNLGSLECFLLMRSLKYAYLY
jgi:cystathionine gamma-synthase